MTIRRGEVYFVDLDPVEGREQAGNRPVLVLSIDAINKLPLVVTVVVGTKGANVARTITPMFACRPKKAAFPWKPCSCASRFARWIPAGSRTRLPERSAGRR